MRPHASREGEEDVRTCQPPGHGTARVWHGIRKRSKRPLQRARIGEQHVPDWKLHGLDANTPLRLFTTSLLLKFSFDRSVTSSAGRQCQSHCATYYLSGAYSRVPRAKARVPFEILRTYDLNTREP